MFYTVENEQEKTYLQAGGDFRDIRFTDDPERSQTYGRFVSADQVALYWSQALGVKLSVVRYDGAWIKTA